MPQSPEDSTTLQGVFLEAVELREERVPNERGELVYYNFGRFSTATGDFERLRLTSEPEQRSTGSPDGSSPRHPTATRSPTGQRLRLA